MGGKGETMSVMGGAAAANPNLEAVHVEVNDGSSKESEELAEGEAADDGDTKRAAKFRADAAADGKRKRTEERGHGSHEDGPEAEEASFVNGFDGSEAFLRFGLNGEVNHEDGVFLDDADEEDDAD
jgi:hypothetical protein